MASEDLPAVRDSVRNKVVSRPDESSIISFARTLRQHQPVGPEDLDFPRGAIVTVHDLASANRARGTFQGRTGLFPCSYVEPVRQARALYDFQAPCPGNLGLRKGDIIYVVDTNEWGWLLGWRQGTAGIVPSSSVEKFIVPKYVYDGCWWQPWPGRSPYDQMVLEESKRSEERAASHGFATPPTSDQLVQQGSNRPESYSLSIYADEDFRAMSSGAQPVYTHGSYRTESSSARPVYDNGNYRAVSSTTRPVYNHEGYRAESSSSRPVYNNESCRTMSSTARAV